MSLFLFNLFTLKKIIKKEKNMINPRRDKEDVARIAKSETLKGLIPALGKKDKIVPYSERIKKERKERKESKDDSAKELLDKSIKYYNKHFTQSTITLDLKKSIDENLDTFTEEQLFETQKILDYCHNPLDFNNDAKRLITSIPNHTLMHYISMKIKQKIPAFEERMELKRLEEQVSKVELRKKELKEIIKEAQNEHFKKIAKKEEGNICPYCNQEFGNAGGLASHMRACKKKNGE